MGEEVERKFLVAGDSWRERATGSRRIVQAYLAGGDKVQIRVRIVDGAAAFLTIKSAASGLSRQEFEYSVPLADAEALLGLCQGRLISKRRFDVPDQAGRNWEVDVFEGEHAGLCLAELEQGRGETDPSEVALPDWLGREVTGDPVYYNAKLARGK
jgi:adenylate cyclase